MTRRSAYLTLAVLMLLGVTGMLSPVAGSRAVVADHEVAHFHVGASVDTTPVVGECTRTHGFWLAHPALTGHILGEHLGGMVDCGWVQLTTTEQVLGALAADPKRDAQGVIRDRLGRARVLCTRQLVAAILSTGFTNGAELPMDPVTGLPMATAARNALVAGDVSECLRLAELIDAFLQAYCEVEIVLDCGYVIEPPNTAAGLALADLTVLDVLPAAPSAADKPQAPTDEPATPAPAEETTAAPPPAPEAEPSTPSSPPAPATNASGSSAAN